MSNINKALLIILGLNALAWGNIVTKTVIDNNKRIQELEKLADTPMWEPGTIDLPK